MRDKIGKGSETAWKDESVFYLMAEDKSYPCVWKAWLRVTVIYIWEGILLHCCAVRKSKWGSLTKWKGIIEQVFSFLICWWIVQLCFIYSWLFRYFVCFHAPVTLVQEMLSIYIHINMSGAGCRWWSVSQSYKKGWVL